MSADLPPPSNISAEVKFPAPTNALQAPLTPAAAHPTAGLALARLPARRNDSLDQLLQQMESWDASDLHIESGETKYRIAGDLRNIDLTFEDLDIRHAVAGLLREEQRAVFDREHFIDFSIQLEGGARFRANAFEHTGGIALAIRLIPSTPPTINQLKMLPTVKSVLIDLAQRPRGLILIAGSTGSGKSTTLAAMIDQILRNPVNVITLENPPEFDLSKTSGKQGSIKQIEVGKHVESFAAGIKNAMRQNPDVILVGEMRDVAEVDAALQAAETGHLVLATVHSRGAVSAIERLTGMYNDERLNTVRLQLSQVLQGVVFQSLVKLKENPEHRMAACEVMLAHPGISNQIRDGKNQMIASTMQTMGKTGMVLLDDQLVELSKTHKLITAEEAIRVSNSPDEVKRQIGSQLRAVAS
jgi:twitching motility protein PilT